MQRAMIGTSTGTIPTREPPVGARRRGKLQELLRKLRAESAKQVGCAGYFRYLKERTVEVVPLKRVVPRKLSLSPLGERLLLFRLFS